MVANRRFPNVQEQLRRYNENPGDARAAEMVAVAFVMQARQSAREGLRLYPNAAVLQSRMQVLEQLTAALK